MDHPSRNNIVDLTAIMARSKASANRPAYTIRNDGDGWALEGRERPWTADELEKIIGTLREIIRTLNDEARDIAGLTPNQILVTIEVYEDGLVNTWTSSRLETDDHVVWARDCVSAAGIAKGGR